MPNAVTSVEESKDTELKPVIMPKCQWKAPNEVALVEQSKEITQSISPQLPMIFLPQWMNELQAYKGYDTY